MDNKTKLNWVIAVWLFIWIVTMITIKEVKGDVKSAPVDNLVRISVNHPLGDSGGSGFLIGDRTVITAKHVVDVNDVPYFVQYSDGHIEMINNETIVRSNRDDLAMFQVQRTFGVELKIQKELAEIGDEIYIIGHPYVYRTPYFSTGIVGSDRVKMRFIGGYYNEVVMMDAHIVPGCSGGPVFNMDDEVVGVAVGASRLITAMVDSVLLTRFLR